MKEDSQLICPIGFDDPTNIWPNIQNQILERLPLRDVTWKSPISSTYTTISKLPVRFLPSSTALFRDTDHPFKWFLGPYVHVYFVSSESSENYKLVKPYIRQWLESHTGLKRTSWLIVYAPINKAVSYDVCLKIYNKLSSDFYIEKSGDRSVMINTGLANTQHNKHGSNNSFDDFLTRIRDGVVSSFQQRCTLYDVDIRRLDSLRGSPQLDFQQLFLVKESLALMYQMMQLPSEALVQYEELEALLAFVPSGFLPDTSWPWMIPELYKSSQSTSKGNKNAESTIESSPLGSATRRMIEQYEDMVADRDLSEMSIPTPGPITIGTGNNNPTPSPPPISPHIYTPTSSTNIKEYDGWMSACRNGDEVLLYSMNNARSKVLKNKISLVELSRYIFARQMYLLFILKKPVGCAEKGFSFVVSTRAYIERKCAFEAMHTHAYESTGGTDAETEHRLKLLQADLWVAVAAMKIVRACIDAFRHINSTALDSSSNNIEAISKSQVLDDTDTTLTSISSGGNKLALDDQSIASLKQLGDLLRFSFSKLCNILPTIRSSRRAAFKMAEALVSWTSYEETRAKLIADGVIHSSSYQVTWPADDSSGAINIEEILSSVSKRLRYLASSFSVSKNQKRELDVASASASNQQQQPQTAEVYGSPQSSLSFSDPRAFDDLSSLINRTSSSSFSSSSSSSSRTAAKTTAVEASIPIHLSRAIAELDALAGSLYIFSS